MRPVQVRIIAPLLFGLLLHGVATPQSAWAQQPADAAASPAAQPPKADPKAERMTALYNQGIEAAQAGDWPKARAAFAEALSLEPRHYQIAANLGRAEFMMGKYRDAAEHLSFFLRTAPPSVTPQDKARVQEMLDKALTRIGVLTVSTDVQGAEVLVDGASVGQTPIQERIFVEPGRRKVEARHASRAPAVEEIDIAAGGSREVSMKLPPKVSVEQPGTGPKKSHVVPFVIGASATGLAVGAGIVLAVLSNGKASSADEERAPLARYGNDACAGDVPAERVAACNKLGDLVSSKTTLANASFWSFVGAGALGAGTVIYLVLNREKKAPTGTASIAPVVHGDGGGLLLHGHW